MTKLVNLTSKSDMIGGIASTLCLIHCLATPVLFLAQAGLAVGEEFHPWWWGILDLMFLVVSLLAVYWSAKNTLKQGIKYALWCLWTILALLILNEKMELVYLTEEFIYLPTIGLIALHFYNQRYFRCKDRGCSIHK